MKKSYSRRFSEFRHGVWMAFTGLHPSENKKLTAFVAGFVAVLFSLLLIVNAAVDFMLRIGGAR